MCSQGASHVHNVQQSLSIMNYSKVFVFPVGKWITGSFSHAQYATVAEYYELV